VNKNKSVYLATLGPVGIWPASGTIAALVALPFVYCFEQSGITLVDRCVLLSIFFLVATFWCKEALAYYKSPDPSAIVIDEVVGCFVACLGVPYGWLWLGCFVLFRLFDISKCCGIRYLEFNNAWGVMVDDLAAGLLANLTIRGVYELVVYLL
jgi:phosphatidylglycerophosphatase A